VMEGRVLVVCVVTSDSDVVGYQRCGGRCDLHLHLRPLMEPKDPLSYSQ
jgi:hypothetical protein